MANVFLSYDHEDDHLARPLIGALQKAGHSVWYDRHIHGGAQFSRKIEQALDDADAVVVLWSERSLESAWVRDEAAEGRDRGKLVPLSVGNVTPPMGFRQFQTISLGAWKGRGRVPRVSDLLEAVETQAQRLSGPDDRPTISPPTARSRGRGRLIAAATAVAFLLALVVGTWAWLGSGGPPTVAVAAADAGPLSQELARNLLVKLSALQGNATTNVRLLDASASDNAADLRITVNAAERGGQIHASAALVSGREKTILWSKEFEQATEARSDLEEALAFAAARVLGCAIEEASGKHGRLSQELRRIYLNACATLAEVGWDNRAVLPQLRRVTVEAPKFRPAWALLLNAQAGHLSYLGSTGEDVRAASAALKEYIAAARKIDPEMAEATLAELELKPDLPIADAIALLDRAKAQDPHNPAVLVAHSAGMGRVGRMADAVDDAKQAVELDPLSPETRSVLISTLFWAGQDERARAELARAKQLWPGAETIRQAELTIELRAGDFEKVVKGEGWPWPDFPLYAAARRDPSDANVARFLDAVRRQGLDGAALMFAAQSLGEMNRPDEFYALADSINDYDALRQDSYVLFRPWVTPIRRDPRFMRLAARLGLVSYWQKSGTWPDFCSEPELPYDCKSEAAKYA